jgi:CxxC motif-containing protein (DUF1111 family)
MILITTLILFEIALFPSLSSADLSFILPGAPIPGLLFDQADHFKDGRGRFLRVEDVAQGLGPAYNGTSCAGCHNQPTIGGVGNASVLRAGFLRDGHYQSPPGGDIVHLFSIADHACQPHIPADANNLTHRIPIPLYGAGLVEAIPDSVIRTWEDPTDQNGDGIRGRAALVIDPATHTMRVGRFGWKAQQATLLAFSGEAFRNEMGITNDLFPNEVGTGLSAEQLAACDKVADPEDKPDPKSRLRGIDHFTNFMRFLAPVAPLPQTGSIHRGSELFASIGCAACHVPTLLTGPSDVAALDHQAVNAYSEFLLHDIGTGDGVEQGAAMGAEFRTSPLWGLRFRKQLMHDGSALSPEEAIKQHRNESERSRQNFDRLGAPEKLALLDFLSSL